MGKSKRTLKASPAGKAPKRTQAQEKPHSNDKLIAFALRRLDAIAAVITAFVFVSFRLFSSQTVSLSKLHPLDNSWIVDLPFRSTHGSWLGRDVLFTYGFLYELIAGLPSILSGQTQLGFLFRTWPMVQTAISVALVYGVGAVLLGAESVWKRILFFAVLLCFWCPFELRQITVLFVLAVLVRAVLHLSAQNMVLRSVSASLLIAAGFLYSADTGIYSLACFFVVEFWAFWFLPQSRKDLLRFGLFTIFLMTVWVLLVNAVMGHLLEFRLWRGAFEEVSNYRWAMAAAFDLDMFPLLLVVGIATVVVWVAAWVLRRAESPAITRHPVFLVSAMSMMILYFQSGLVRSDSGHIVLATFPAIALSCLILFGSGPVRREISWALMATAVVASGVFAVIRTNGPWDGWRLATPEWLTVDEVSGECPSGTAYFQQTCIDRVPLQLFTWAQNFLDESPDPKAIVFPHENIFAVAAGKVAAGGVLQSYSAHGDFLMDWELEGLRRDRPQLGIYGIDKFGSVPVDGVTNFSRSPKVWFYLQQNYRLAAEGPGGFLGLIRDDERPKHWKESRESLTGFSPRLLPVTEPGVFDLGNVAWAKPYDFLRLDLRFNYPVWWKLRKPSLVTFAVHFADGSRKVARGVFPPNQETEFWLYPWSEAELGRYFQSDPQQWRTQANRPALTGVELTVKPIDAISVLPTAVEVRRIEAVSIGLE